MSYSNDLVDAMLLGHRVMLVKGRNIGKTAFMKATGRPIPPQSSLLSHISIDAVVRNNLLPDAALNVPGSGAFDSWTFHSFVYDRSHHKHVGIVSARHKYVGTHHEQTITVDDGFLQDCLIGHDQQYLMNALLNKLEWAATEIVSRALPPHDINTCTDPECMC